MDLNKTKTTTIRLCGLVLLKINNIWPIITNLTSIAYSLFVTAYIKTIEFAGLDG